MQEPDRQATTDREIAVVVAVLIAAVALVVFLVKAVITA